MPAARTSKLARCQRGVAAAFGLAIVVASCERDSDVRFTPGVITDELLARAEGGDLDAQVQLAANYYSDDEEQAFRWLRAAAEAGHAAAQNEVGYVLERGELGQVVDYDAAFHWFQRSADQGDSIAAHNLGELYRDGRGAPQDHALSTRYFRQSAEDGYELAYCELSHRLEQGLGADVDANEAARWRGRAQQVGRECCSTTPETMSPTPRPWEAVMIEETLILARGDIYDDWNETAFQLARDIVREEADRGRAYFVVGFLGGSMPEAGCEVLEGGETLKQAFGMLSFMPVHEEFALESYYLIDIAARRGHAGAQYELGMYYSREGAPVYADPELARQWLMRSADQGYAAAVEALQTLE